MSRHSATGVCTLDSGCTARVNAALTLLLARKSDGLGHDDLELDRPYLVETVEASRRKPNPPAPDTSESADASPRPAQGDPSWPPLRRYVADDVPNHFGKMTTRTAVALCSRLGDYRWGIYAILLAECQGRTKPEHGLVAGRVKMTGKKLAETLGATRGAVSKAISKLIEVGLISHETTDSGSFFIVYHG